MASRFVLICAVIPSMVSSLFAQTTAPASQPTTAAAQAAVSPEVDQILTRQEKASDAIKDLQADIRHELYQVIPDDRQVKLGFIRYRAAGKRQNARFMVSFDTLIHEDLKVNQKEWFCFDGRWWREIREQTKTAIDHEVVAPDEKIDSFKLEESPLPLPFGQKKADILKNFNVTLIKPEKSDPADTDHLLLIPKPGGKFVKQYERLEFWIDRKLNLPIRIVAADRHANVTTDDFKNLKINTGIPEKQLWIDIPEGYGYEKVPLEGKQ